MILDELRHPIVQAPMAGGTSTPALAIAVCEAGGLGFVAGGYRSVEAMQADIAAVRIGTTAPFGVNLFVPGVRSVTSVAVDEQSVDKHAVDAQALQLYVDRLGPEAEHYGTQVGVPRPDDDGWAAKLSALVADPVPIVSFTFGAPSAREISDLQGVGSQVWLTVTDVAEARAARSAGADVLVLQGVEAGGHRGSWLDVDEPEGLSTFALLRLVSRAVDLPLVAAGGLIDGPGIAAALVAGATAVQLGTAFLLCDEVGTHPVHRERLGGDTPTALTRAFTGRTARALRNRFLDAHTRGAPAAYPQVHFATAPIRAAAREQGDGDGFNLFAGQTYRLATGGSAAELVKSLGAQTRQALATAATRAEP
jgi:nitronate monooxygenase